MKQKSFFGYIIASLFCSMCFMLKSCEKTSSRLSDGARGEKTELCYVESKYLPKSKIIKYFPCLSDHIVLAAGTNSEGYTYGYDHEDVTLYKLVIPQDSRLSDTSFLKEVRTLVESDVYDPTGTVESYIALAWTDPSKRLTFKKLAAMYISTDYIVTKMLGASNKFSQLFFKHYVFRCSCKGLYFDSPTETRAIFDGIGIDLSDDRYKMTDGECSELHKKICQQTDFNKAIVEFNTYIREKSKRTAERLEEDYNEAVAGAGIENKIIKKNIGLLVGGAVLGGVWCFLHKQSVVDAKVLAPTV